MPGERSRTQRFGLDIPPQAEAGVPRDAIDVIREAVDDSPSAPTIVALGPLTNLEDAFAADETLADRLAGVHAMLGTIDAPGNVYVNGLDGADPLEWNAYADPSAVSAVLDSDVPDLARPARCHRRRAGPRGPYRHAQGRSRGRRCGLRLRASAPTSGASPG
jgi:inosine-uridine nucleoside N-ribohydrolase